MTRIIAGHAGALRLGVPKSGTRPTSDRVREALFSSLSAHTQLKSARVLDLYAGSGALGLEAASRGAAFVTLVERDAGAARTLRANVALVHNTLAGRHDATIEVVQRAVATFLREERRSWDLIFLDPPYELGEEELAEDLRRSAALLNPAGLVVVERSSRSPEPSWPTDLADVREKRYGETTLWFATADSASSG